MMLKKIFRSNFPEDVIPNFPQYMKLKLEFFLFDLMLLINILFTIWQAGSYRLIKYEKTHLILVLYLYEAIFFILSLT